MPGPRNYKITVKHWLDESQNEFVGIAEKTIAYAQSGESYVKGVTRAVYGWRKGTGERAGWFIYLINEGHIQKIGTAKRDELNEAWVPSS